MSIQTDRLKQRTLEFAVEILQLVDTLPHTPAGRVLGNQLARSGSSIGSNYRGACTARSRAEFIAKLGVVVEEAEESLYWLDIILTARMTSYEGIQRLRREAAELLAIFARSVGTARSNLETSKKPGR